MSRGIGLERPGIARYVQLATLFRRRIDSGEWEVGARIPTLEQLVAEHGVARATLRQALGALEAEGLLERYRAKGTFVTSRPAPSRAVELATDWASLLRSHEGGAIEVLASRKAERVPWPLAADARFAPSYQYLQRLHRSDGTPYLLGNVYLDARIFRGLPRGALETTPMLRLLKEHNGARIASAHQTLTVGAADIETARLLAIPMNDPVAIVHRVAFDRRRTLLYYSHGTYRGDQVRLEIALK